MTWPITNLEPLRGHLETGGTAITAGNARLMFGVADHLRERVAALESDLRMSETLLEFQSTRYVSARVRIDEQDEENLHSVRTYRSSSQSLQWLDGICK